MLKLTRSIFFTPTKFSLFQSHYNFCTTPTQPTKKSYIMPQRQIIQAYIPKHKINFKNGRYLLYLNKQNLSTPYLLDLHYLTPLTYIGYLIVNNPFYLTFPAALPIMLIIQSILILMYIEHKAHHKRQIQRVYLLETGLQIQLIFANKIRRYLKANQTSMVRNILQFQPKYDQQIQTGKVKPYRGVRFPANPNAPLSAAKIPSALQYGWSFRDNQFNNYILPAKFQYADWQILSQVLNGNIINLNGNFTQQGAFMHGNFPTIQQEQKNIEKLKKQIPQQNKSTKQTIQKHSKSTQK